MEKRAYRDTLRKRYSAFRFSTSGWPTVRPERIRMIRDIKHQTHELGLGSP